MAAVKVTGLLPEDDDDTVEMYFESKSKSGGGEVVSIERRDGGRTAIVTFKESVAAGRVVSKMDHIFLGRPIQVTLHEDDVSSEVRVTGLDPGLHDDFLEMHFESERRSGGGAIKALERRKGGTEAVITFEESTVARRVVARTNPTIKGKPVSISFCKDDVSGETCKVRVTGLDPSLHGDALEMHFESERRSGGGAIKALERRKGGTEAFITFVESEVAKRVASKPGQEIMGRPVRVERYDGGDSGGTGGKSAVKVTAWESADDDRTSIPHNELRIVLMGHTGSGKSASGNTILGQKAFQSMAAAKGVTMKSACKTAQRFGKKINIIDTPGLFDPEFKNKDIANEITKCIGMTSPGPHAFIMVVSVGRFTKEEYDTITEFKKYFGDELMKYLIILFTRVDDLESEGKSLEEFVTGVPKTLAKVLTECDYNYFGFNNRATPDDKDRQVRGLLEKIRQTLEKNGGRFYTNEMLEAAEEAMKQRELAIRKELEEQQQKNKERIEADIAIKWAEREEVLDTAIKKKIDRIKILEGKEKLTEEESSELDRLRCEVIQMTEQKKKEQQTSLKEAAERLKEAEEDFKKKKQETRDMVRKEVEEEKKEGLGLVWEGVKNVGWGLVSTVKNFVS